MSRPSFAAIEGADHMTRTPSGHDPDGWFRYQIRALIIDALRLEQIVRELAESDPTVWYAPDDSSDDAAECPFCAFPHWDHEPDCLWLGAKKVVES